ncbi:DNA topoisomerase 6 subunit A3-like [Lolium perenne]|uniref:DNA topoisomerase 6 subunit A3-like n=1 Tax=Lolium perenne TaxID=4522 RepID=UPI0021EABCB9|nr:DNA topoisomerase 6 subunit A3-like [Lolium perenne]
MAAAVAETAVEAAAEGSDLRSFLTKRGVDTAEVDDQALKELEEKYIIVRDLDADTVLSKIQNLLGLRHKEDSIVAYEGLTYQLPSRGMEHQEYEPLLRQLCLRRGKVDCCAVSDPKTSRWAKAITAVLSAVQKQLLCGKRTSSHFLCYGEKLFGKGHKTVDDALLDICCLLECTRTSLNLYHVSQGMVIGPVIFTREDGVVIPCSSLGPDGAYIQPKFSKITAAPGAEVNFILVVQGASVFDTFARGRGDQFLREFSCVLVTGGDGQPDITTRAFLRKLKDQLSVPVYALVNPDPEGLSIFCTYKYGSPEGPFDNAGLTVPDIEWIGVHLGDALDLDIKEGLPLTKQDVSILEGLCANKYVMGDDLFRTNIHFMLYRGLKSKIEALFYRQYPPSDYIRKEINNHEDT